MKQNKKGKNCAVFCFAEKKNYYFIYYAVIVKQKIYKRSTNHYSRTCKGFYQVMCLGIVEVRG